MAIKIRDRVPIQVVESREDADTRGASELLGCRFMGVLLHPVPWTEMQRRFDVNGPGCRVVVQWPSGHCDGRLVTVGDVLQIGDSTYTVCGVVEHPGCYMELYLATA
jgi:hypothetical protein